MAAKRSCLSLIYIRHGFGIVMSCGTENFARCVVMGMTDEERDRMYSEHGVSKDEIGFWYTSPERVECFECGAQYDTRLDLPGAP
jgi:hypothetical protein